MIFRTTLILLVIAIGLGAYIGVYERSDLSRPDQRRKVSGKTLANFDPAGISRIVIESGDTATELKRYKIYWIFAKPIGDRASAQTVASLLDQLSHLAIQDELHPSELINSPELSDEALGFESDAVVRVSLYQSDEAGDEQQAPVAVLALGKPAPLTNTLYARVEGAPERAALTYVVSGAPRQYLTDPVSALRDRSLLGIPTDQIVRAVVRTAGGEVEVTRKITPPQVGWTLTRPLQTRADTALVEDFLSRLAALQIAEVVEEKASSSALPNQIPSGAARIDLTVYGWDQPLSLYLAAKPGTTPSPAAPPVVIDADPDPAQPAVATTATAGDPQAQRLIARVSTRPGIYEIRSSLLAQIPDSPAEFRDPYLARIPVQYLQSINIVSRTDPNVRLTSEPSAEGVRWYSARSGVKDRANLDRLKRMLNAINGGRVLDFQQVGPGELDKYGLNSPELRIAFNFHPPQAEDGAAPVKGQQRILQFARTDESTLFANFLDEPWVYRVDPTIRSSIATHPLKWRDLQVLNFNLIGLKKIERQPAGSPPLTLDYEYAVDQWSGTEGGLDISISIDTERAMLVARTLGSLEAVDWITNLQDAYQRLEDPSLEIAITRREIDPLTNTMISVADELRFAKAPGVGYYGNVVGTPDVFLIDRATFRDISIPLTSP